MEKSLTQRIEDLEAVQNTKDTDFDTLIENQRLQDEVIRDLISQIGKVPSAIKYVRDYKQI